MSRNAYRASTGPCDFALPDRQNPKRRGILLLSLATTASLTGSAFAADLTPPPPVPAFTWSGLYVGAQIGYLWGQDNAPWSGTANDLDPAAGSFGLGQQGVIGGAHVGYNLQLNPWFVIGLEASVDGTSASRTVTVPVADFAGDTFGSFTARATAPVQGSVRGRIGVAFDRVLVFGTGGVGITSFNTSDFDRTGFFTGDPTANTTISGTRAGFTAGGGVEYAVTDNWSVRAEYRYTNFGHTTDFPFTNPNNNVLPAGGNFAVSHHLTENQVQVGFSYRFDWTVPPAPPPAPMITKY